MDFISPLVGGAMGIAQTAFNNWLGAESAEKSRERNFYYNEQAAINADVRQRRMYNDFYSPEALMKQYKQAGLSPSMMFGGTPGQGGASGNMSAGAAGIQNPIMPYSFLESAEAANLIAQTQKTKAETANIEKDTDLKKIEESFNNIKLGAYKDEMRVLTTGITDENGNPSSLYEQADKFRTVEGFIKYAQENFGMGSKETDSSILRSIYMARKHFATDIATLSEQKVSSEFQLEVIEAMDNENFQKLNAKAAVGYLRSNIETAELTETQKKAWNNLLNKLGEENDTVRDIVIVLGLMFNNAMTNWHMPNIRNSTLTNTAYNTTHNHIKN